MIKRFDQFIDKRNLCHKPDKILLAVSGGIDSIVLLDLFMKKGFNVGIAHCNFKLRGQESDGDEKFVKELSVKLDVPLFVKRFETENYAEKSGISIQMAARELRYTWFEELRREKDYDLIATAHNFNDSVETVIFNLIKGTGLKGLTGISARTSNDAVAVSPNKVTGSLLIVLQCSIALVPRFKYGVLKSCPHSETQWTSSMTQYPK